MINYKKELNIEQYLAVTTTEGPLLIIAGAGTGKTRTIVYRTAYLLEHNVSPNEILMLTFTNKAANEMSDRVSDLLGEENAKGITACTFHSFCVLMLRRFSEYINLKPGFTIIDASDDAEIINMKKTESKEHRYDKRGFPPSSKIVDIISKSINQNTTIEKILEEKKNSKYAPFADDICELKILSDKYKTENSMLNYDDMLLKLNQLLREYPKVAEKISDIYTYIMVDEYQDTNALQEQILCHLRKENSNLAVVGDDMQSLYAFRGADVHNILDFPDKYKDCKIIKLIQNYRSNQEILDVANHVMECATEGFKKNLKGTYYSGSLPIVHCVPNQAVESDTVMDIIYKAHDNGVPYNEICILGRKSFLTSKVEVNLAKDGINYVKYGGTKFLELECVKDILSYLRVLSRKEDEIALFRILKIHYGIGDHNAKLIASECKDFGIDHLLDKKYTKRIFGGELLNLYNELEKVQDMELTPLVKEIIRFYVETKKNNIEKMKVRTESSRTEYLEMLENNEMVLGELVSMSENYKSITSFLDNLLLDNTALTQNNPEEGAVVVSTIHSVKGLEYEVVIIMDCIDEIFPSTTKEQIGNKEDNEELRCFYVAVTRAKKELHLMFPNFAQMYNTQIRGTLSHYLDDGEHLYQNIHHW